MKKIILLFAILGFSAFVMAQAQDSTIVLKNFRHIHKKFFNAGVIFSKDVKYTVLDYDFDKRYTPTIDDIIKAELIFYKKYNLYAMQNKWIYYYEIVPNVRKKFKRWNRQYIGYINKKGEKIIIMHLLNFNIKIIANKRFANWEKKIVIGTGRYYGRNMDIYYINIDRVTLFQL